MCLSCYRCSCVAAREAPWGSWDGGNLGTVQNIFCPAYTWGAFSEGAAGAALAAMSWWARCRPERRPLQGAAEGEGLLARAIRTLLVSSAGIQHWQLGSHEFFRTMCSHSVGQEILRSIERVTFHICPKTWVPNQLLCNWLDTTEKL